MPLDKNILKKKIFGIPVPIVAVGAGVAGVIAYRKFGAGGGSSTSSDGAATPSDYSGGTAGSGGSASDYSGGSGDYGSSADLGLGSGGGASYGSGGGAYLPATDSGQIGGQQIVNRVVRIIRPAARGRRIRIVNRVVINPRAIPQNRRRPNVVHGDQRVPSPTHDPRRFGGASTGQRSGNPNRTPPIIRVGRRPRAGMH